MKAVTRSFLVTKPGCKNSLWKYQPKRTYSTQNEKESNDNSSKSQKGRSRIGFVLLPLAAFGLGVWQTARLKWKEGIIEERKKKVNDPPVVLSAEAFK